MRLTSGSQLGCGKESKTALWTSGIDREKEIIKSWDDEYGNDKPWETCVYETAWLKDFTEA